MPESPRLLEQVRHAIRLRHYSFATEKAYVQWIRRFILTNNKRHPGDMGASEVRAFLTALAVKKHVSPSTQNQAFSAILSLYHRVLEIEEDDYDLYARSQSGWASSKKPDGLGVA